MKKIIERHKKFWSDRQAAVSSVSGIVFFIASVVVSFLTQNYAASRMSNGVNDLFLDILPRYNVDIIFIEGAVALFIFVVLLLVYEPRRLPFVVKSAALFILIRAAFTTLTHLGPTFPESVDFGAGGVLQGLTSGGDYFFSGHTGMPFLFALLFWQMKKLRIVFLSVSILFAVSALIGHLHYSIDVFAAFFITYSIYCIAKRAFEKDHQLFLSGDRFLSNP